MKYTVTVKEKEQLDVFLRSVVPSLVNAEVSNSKIRRLIVAGCVFINGKQCRSPSASLKVSQRVDIEIDQEKLFFEKQAFDKAFVIQSSDVLFEDESLIIINKAPFIPVEETIVKGRANVHQSVVDYLWKENPSLRNPPYAGIMHRLDHQTSGVLLFTKTRAVNASIHQQFESHSIKKIYRAVCTKKTNAPIEKEFTVSLSMGRISPKSAPCKMGLLSEKNGGLPSVTQFRVHEVKDDLYYIDAFLHTGRTHQIRFHLSQKGLPLVGDTLYGGSEGFKQFDNRIMLHAFSLTFEHPLTKKSCTVTAPLPQGFGSL